MRKNAFAEAEIETIEGIVRQVDVDGGRRFQGLVLSQVVDVFPDGVVIASNKGHVLRCNDMGKRMFQRSQISPQARLGSCLSTTDFKQTVSGQASLPWETEIRGAKGKKTPALMSKFILPDEYDHVVLRLQDVAELEWKTDVERLEAALAEAASLVRVPLSLVSSYSADEAKAGEDSADLVDKAFRQLGSIELTYDRIFAACGSNDVPQERQTRVDINQLIEYILDELSESDKAAVKWTFAEGPIWVPAASYRLLFALESMLAYLLRSRSMSEITLEVKVWRRKFVEIVMTTRAVGRAQRRSGKLVEATRSEIALGEVLARENCARVRRCFRARESARSRSNCHCG